MRNFDQLSVDEQAIAYREATKQVLKYILMGITFDDEMNGDDLQSRIDKAVEEAEAMETPWFAGEYIMDVAREEIEAMGRADAERAIYLDSGEFVVYLPKE